jgi:hypothetical protein
VALIMSPTQASPLQQVDGIAAGSHAAATSPHVGLVGKSTLTCALAFFVIVSDTTAGEVPVTFVVTVFER